jgi:hypothetical protein
VRCGGDHRYRQLDKRALERYQARLFEEGSHRKRQLSTFTVNSYVRTVNVFLAWARRYPLNIAALERGSRRAIGTWSE